MVVSIRMTLSDLQGHSQPAFPSVIVLRTADDKMNDKNYYLSEFAIIGDTLQREGVRKHV